MQLLVPALAVVLVAMAFLRRDALTAAMSALLLLYVWFTRHTRYEIYPDRLVIHYGAPRKKPLLLADVAEVRVTRTPMGGSSIVIVRKRGGGLVINPRDPEGFAAKLAEASGIAKHQTPENPTGISRKKGARPRKTPQRDS